MQVSSVVTSLPVQPSQPVQENRSTSGSTQDDQVSQSQPPSGMDKAATKEGVGRYMDITA